MMKPKPYEDLISDMMRENVREFEKRHFKDLYEKEFEKVADVKFPDRVRKPRKSAHILRQSARLLDDDQLNTYEFYRLDHADGIAVEIHQLEKPYLSHKSPNESSTYQFVVSKLFLHRSYSQFMTKEQAVDYWKTLVSGGWKRGPNVKHKVRGKIALRLADGYNWDSHEGTINEY
ncbi:MAG: hypothetical protein VX063_03840 [SAR324 cluster bacterium]|nr:hypothetical protein [SAR324 cluster bacterium]